MKKLWCGLVTAFSMYSALPMPQVEWTADSMKYALCFFPVVGAVIGALCGLWGWLCMTFGLSAFPWTALWTPPTASTPTWNLPKSWKS